MTWWIINRHSIHEKNLYTIFLFFLFWIQQSQIGMVIGVLSIKLESEGQFLYNLNNKNFLKFFSSPLFSLHPWHGWFLLMVDQWKGFQSPLSLSFTREAQLFSKFYVINFFFFFSMWTHMISPFNFPFSIHFFYPWIF